MPAPKYVQRIARLPHVFEILATHPQGMSLTELATEVGTTAAELHTDLLAFYSAELNPVLFGLSRPESIEFFSSASGGEVDPNDADRVRLIDDRPAEEIGVERVDAGELALVYTAATALAETEPGNADLAAAISVLTDAVFGDGAPEARAHGMSTELNAADAEFLGDRFTFIDCPGSVELQSEADAALAAVDAAVVVTEPDPKRVPALQVILKQLEDRGIPRFLFLNKIDSFETPVREILPMLQPASTTPLVLRQVCHRTFGCPPCTLSFEVIFSSTGSSRLPR